MRNDYLCREFVITGWFNSPGEADAFTALLREWFDRMDWDDSVGAHNLTLDTPLSDVIAQRRCDCSICQMTSEEELL